MKRHTILDVYRDGPWYKVCCANGDVFTTPHLNGNCCYDRDLGLRTTSAFYVPEKDEFVFFNPEHKQECLRHWNVTEGLHDTSGGHSFPNAEALMEHFRKYGLATATVTQLPQPTQMAVAA